MRFLAKSLLLVFLVFIAAAYMHGCNTAEETTGKIAYSQGDFEKAEMEFDKETKQNPSNEEAWFYLAMSRIQLNKLEPAETALKEYRKLGKHTYDSDITKIWGDKYDAGYNTFENAKKSADTSQSMKLYKQAINNFKAALILLPDSVFVQKNIDVINNRIASIKVKPLIDKGADLIKEEKYEDAIEQFKKAEDVGIEKDNPVIEVLNYNMGLAYAKLGEKLRIANSEDNTYKEKYKLALPYLEGLVNSKDKSMQISTYELLVSVYANLSMQDEAKKTLEKLKELKGENENK